jgi:hypothetical protein
MLLAETIENSSILWFLLVVLAICAIVFFIRGI